MCYIYNNKGWDTKCAFITDQGKKVTYELLRNMVNDLANSLLGNTIAIAILSNDLNSIIFYLACLQRKIVPIILNPFISINQIQQYIQKYDPEYIFFSQQNSDINNEILKYHYCEIENLSVWYIFENQRSRCKKINEELAILLPTSGTTHISKLVRISRKNLFDNTRKICETLKINESDIAVTSLPISYTYGLSILNTHLSCHATILLTNKSVLQKSFWEISNQYHVTSFAGVPYTYELLEKSGHLKKETTIKTYTQAGGKLSLRLQDLFVQQCKKTDKKFYVMYGQTEATARMSVLQMEDAERKSGSVGQAIAGGNFQIQKKHPLDREGEIQYTGENVCMGYCNCLHDLELGDINAGVLKTGDFGYLDEEGFLYITGRKSDFVKLYGRRLNLNMISQTIEEQWGIKTICKVKKNTIVVIYEEEAQESMLSIQKELHKHLHLSRSDLCYYKIDKFERTYNGKVCFGGKYEQYI